MRRATGSSIVEVMVMMLIISVSIVGIYSMVNNGQQLAALADDRLTGINIAKEGIESIGALRDTFALRAYGATNCFFTIDGTNYGICPLLSSTGTHYILTDDKKLKAINPTDDHPICINQDGWYSQTYYSPSKPCSSLVADLCGGDKTTSCLTRFSRRITFANCSNPSDTHQCIKAKVEVSWATAGDIKLNRDDDKTIVLEQIFTKK